MDAEKPVSAAESAGPTTAVTSRREFLSWYLWIGLVLSVAACFLGWAAWSLALPGSRHPVLLTAAACASSLVSLLLLRIGSDVFRSHAKKGPQPTAARAALIVLAFGVAVAAFGSTDELLKLRLRQNVDELNERANAALVDSSGRDDEYIYRTFPGCAPQQMAFSEVGPFRYQGCPRVDASAPGREVFFFDWGSPRFDDGPLPFGLVYSPDGAPTVGPEACINELSGGWYEVWTPRTDPSCPFGLSHADQV